MAFLRSLTKIMILILQPHTFSEDMSTLNSDLLYSVFQLLFIVTFLVH